MRHLIIISLILCSCSATHHAKQARKHADKAEQKQPGIIKDQEVVDTITFTKVVLDTIHTSDSTFYIERREFSYDTIIKIQYQKYDFSEIRTWFEIQQEEKTKRIQIRNDRKEEQTEAKQDGRTDRSEIRNDRKVKKQKSWWWIWMIVGAVIMNLIPVIWKRLTRKQ